jgi:hypothetical protein
MRRVTPLVSAGFLFQANGCTLDTNALLAGLTTTIVNNLISSFIFGAFNLVPGP